MCHEDSKPNGELADFAQLSFINALPQYTELAIGGGNPLSHPHLITWLDLLRTKRLIPSMTVNQLHFMNNVSFLHRLSDEHFIYGLGVSWNGFYSEEQAMKCVEVLQEFPNAVVHVINGLVTMKDLDLLSNAGLKVLILGYKDFRRGADYHLQYPGVIDAQKQQLYDALPGLVASNAFKCICFDNLAVKQLDVKRLLTDAEWDSFYMGDDGSFTMYIDAVKGEYAASSTSTQRYSVTADIREMFQTIRNERKTSK
jgi:hypothetical protein